MNISYFRFFLFDLKIFGEIVTTFFIKTTKFWIVTAIVKIFKIFNLINLLSNLLELK